MSFCLTKSAADNFRKMLRNKQINPEILADMSSEERNKFFSSVVGPENSGDVNALFESKLLLKNQKAGFISWAKKTAGLYKDSPDLMSKIEKLDKVLNPLEEKDFLKDLAAKKLGTDVSFEQVKKISEKTAKLKEVSSEKDAVGNHTIEYFKRLKDVQDYVKSLNENPLSSHVTSIFRNLLLTSIKTPLKVFAETNINRFIESGVKKAAYRSAGNLTSDLQAAYVKNAKEIYSKTGFNISSMDSMTEGNMFGDIFAHHEGQSEGLKSIPRKVAKGLDTAAIHYGHGLTFSDNFNKSFAQSVGLEAERIAKSEGLNGVNLKNRATELAKEAMKVGTSDKIGKEIRAQAQQDAMRVTNTNDTYGSVIAKALKGALNKAFPNLGDALVPFSKIPGNIIANSFGVAGLDVPRAAFEFKNAITKGTSLVQPTRTLIRTMGSMGAALWIASNIDKDHYNEKKGMVRIGNTWVSLELFGILGPSITGFLKAKEGKSGDSSIYNYVKGAAEGLKRLPGLNEINSIKDYGIKSFAKNFISSRVSPAIIGDVVKANKQSTINPILFGSKVKSDDQMKQDKANAIERKRQNKSLYK